MTCRLVTGEETNLRNTHIVNSKWTGLAHSCVEFALDANNRGAAAQTLTQVETLVDGAQILHVLLLLLS